MQASLYVRRGPHSGAVFPVYSTAITLVGRAASNHVVLRDGSVSANHCVLAPCRGGEGFVLLDAHSRSEPQVNRRPFTKGHVTLGDVLTVGAFELELVPADRPWPTPKPLRPTSGGPARFQFGRSRRREFLPLPPGSATVVGRGPYAHIRVDHALISEYHCLIALDPDSPSAMPVLIDLRSSNGTYVHGRAIHRKHILPQDALLLGRTTFELRRLDVREAPAASRRKHVPPRKRRGAAADIPSPAAPEPAATPAPRPVAPAMSAPRPAVQAPAASARAGLGEQLAFLAGEEQLRDLVAVPPLADHLGVTCYLAPMPADGVAAYVLHRVRLASDEDRPLFTRRALEMLAAYSGGIPRLINNVADAALCHAYLHDAHEVTPDLLAAALDELLHADS